MSHEPSGKPVCTSTSAERVVLPHLELAARFDGCVDKLVTMSGSQATPEIQEHYVDLMVGLSNAATAMRAVATEDSETTVSNLRLAIEHLQRVDTTGMSFPAGTAWKPDFP